MWCSMNHVWWWRGEKEGGSDPAPPYYHVQGDRVREIMADTQPGPIRIKLVTQLEGSYLDAAGKKRLAEQLAPGAVAVIQKYVQVRAKGWCPGGLWPRCLHTASSSERLRQCQVFDIPMAQTQQSCTDKLSSSTNSQKHSNSRSNVP